MTKVYMGLDYGKRSIGVAIGNTLTNTAEGVGIVTASKGVPNWQQLDNYVKQWQPSAFVLGWPLNMDGTEQNLTKAVAVFEKNLGIRYELPCYKADERLSTHEAKTILGKASKDKKKVDCLSAVILLEQWLHEVSAKGN